MALIRTATTTKNGEATSRISDDTTMSKDRLRNREPGAQRRRGDVQHGQPGQVLDVGAAGDQLVVPGDDGHPHLAGQALEHLGGALGMGAGEADHHPGHAVLAAQRREVLELADHVAPPQRVVVDEPDEVDAGVGPQVAGHRLGQLAGPHHDDRDRAHRGPTEQTEGHRPGPAER